MLSYCEQITTKGFAIIEDFLPSESVSIWIETLSPLQEEVAQVSGGVRNLMRRSPAVAEFAINEDIRALVAPILGPECFPVRAILFDKTPLTNWKIPWHQDVTIAVREKISCEGYGPWSVKAGIQHVQPPAQVLEQMLSVRIHLDDCPADNGALKVLPGSHKSGKLRHSETDLFVSTHDPVVCEVRSGGVLLMRPLLLHSSSESTLRKSNQHRRVIHLDYAAIELPCGLVWDEKSSSTTT